MTLISVVIPTFKDSRLDKCLDAIEKQANQDFDFEVIVGNNAPDDRLDLKDKYSYNLEVVSESVAGSYAARNKALEIASGDYVLFTDSDCIPKDNWLLSAKRAISENKEDLIAGKVEIFSYSGSTYGKFEKAFAFPNRDYVEKEGFGVTANLLVNRKVFQEIGGFKQGLLTGGDAEFCQRAIQRGFSITYYDEMQVFHPARETWSEMKVKAKRFGGKIPKDDNKLLVLLKILAKYRVRNQDFSSVNKLEKPIGEKLSFLMILARIRCVEATESLRVFFGKSPGRL